MTLKEFEKEYCSMCGTQRCGGATDEDFREGCPFYIEKYSEIADQLGKETAKH